MFPSRRVLFVASTVATLGACATASGKHTDVNAPAPSPTASGVIVGTNTSGIARAAIVAATAGGAAGELIGKQMDRQAKELAQNIPNARVERIGEGIVVTLFTGQLFEFDSDRVLGESERNLRALARSLDKYRGTSLLIVGHTDSIGTTAHNHDLSLRRARATAAYLTSQGTLLERMKSDGRGEAEPAGSNDTEAGQARNRRVEIAIYADAAMRAQFAAQAMKKK
jgi:outer membrane protein OmpA-like peptidoglycan-associated protein